MLHSNVFSNGKWVYVSDFAKTLDLLKNVLYRLVVSVIFCQLTRASLFVRWQKITLTTRLYKPFVNRSRVCKIWYVHPFSITKDIGMQQNSIASECSEAAPLARATHHCTSANHTKQHPIKESKSTTLRTSLLWYNSARITNSNIIFHWVKIIHQKSRFTLTMYAMCYIVRGCNKAQSQPSYRLRA